MLSYKSNRILFFLALAFFIADLIHSFLIYYYVSFDGDFPSHTLPVSEFNAVFADPLAIKCALHKTVYQNPNRFFSHWTFLTYFNTLPFGLQHIVSPIKSLYLSAAFAKWLCHLSLIVTIVFVSLGKFKFQLETLIALCITSVLFQGNGYNGSMGIIDNAITYVFFYAIPLLFIALYYLPYFIETIHHQQFIHPKLRIFWYLGWAPVVCLGGPVNPGIVLVLNLLIVIKLIITQIQTYQSFPEFLNSFFKSINYQLLVPISLLALYSLYVGQFNYSAIDQEKPLWSIYALLPQGFIHTFFGKGYALFLLIISINSLILWRINSLASSKILNYLAWIGVFSFIYILLLPLGGYRNYREFCIRYDTILPITFALFVYFCMSSICILREIENKWLKNIIYSYLALVIFIFSKADKIKTDNYYSERNAMLMIQSSDKNYFELKTNVPFFSWYYYEKPEQSTLVSDCLLKFNIIHRPITYTQHKEN